MIVLAASSLLKMIFPIAVIAIGLILVRCIERFDERSVAAVCLFIFIPALIFRQALGQSPETSQFSFVFFFVLFHTAILYLLAGKFLQYLELSPHIQCLYLINILIVGNAGLRQIPSWTGNPVEAAQSANTLFFYQLAILALLGIYLSGGYSRLSKNVSLILKTPLLYALLAGLILATAKTELPYNILGSIDFFHNAAVPLTLLLLGVIFGKYFYFTQLSEYSVLIPGLAACLAFRLVVSPVLAMAVTLLMGMDNVTLQRVLIVESGAPTGIFAAVLISFYGKQNETRFTVICILLTLLFSYLTHPIIHILLNRCFPLG